MAPPKVQARQTAKLAERHAHRWDLQRQSGAEEGVAPCVAISGGAVYISPASSSVPVTAWIKRASGRAATEPDTLAPPAWRSKQDSTCWSSPNTSTPG